MSKRTLYVSFFISMALMLGFIYLIYSGNTDEYTGIIFWLYSSNINIYVTCLLLFFITFFSIRLVSCFIVKEKAVSLGHVYSLPPVKQLVLTCIFVVVGFGMFSQWGLVEQFKEVGVSNGTYNDFPMSLRVIIMLVAFSWMGYVTIKNRDINQESLVVIYIAALLITFMSLYIVNPFCQTARINDDFTQTNLSNNTSVTETIYNVLDGTPFTYSTSGLYGHYALFFLIPLKIFGSRNPYAVMALLGGVGCIAQLATIYIIHMFDLKRWIKATLVLASVIRTTYTYPAVSPIRTLFPLLLCAYMAFIYKRKAPLRWNSKWFWIGFFLCTCAVLWNLETGVGCAIGFAAYILTSQWQKYPLYHTKMFITYASMFFMVIGNILSAILLLNVYNFLCGARFFVFQAFFYPYVGSSWVSDALRCNVPLGNHAWVYIIILLFGMVCWALYHTKIFKIDNNMSEAPLVAGISVVGIIVFVYYFNEAHWGCMEIVHQIAVVLSTVLIAKLWPVVTNLKKYCQIEHLWYRAIVIIAIMIYTTLALQTFNDPVRIHVRHAAGAYSLESVFKDLEQLEANIPYNTYGVGQGINIIYQMLGWKNHANFRDTSAIYNVADNSGVYDALVNEIISQDSFLICESTKYDKAILESIMSIDPTYVKQEIIEIGAYSYGYYVRER